MKLAPDRAAACQAALRRVVRTAQEAADAPNTDAARKALAAVWFAVHEAQALVTDAENATRRERLAQLEHTA